MKKFLGTLILLLSGVVNAQTFQDLLKPENLIQSWKKAVVFEPDSFFPKSIDFLHSPSKYPILIYLHGCSGLNADSTEWARTIKRFGFIVVQPDSFAIPGRKMNCNPQTQTTQVVEGFDSFKLRNNELRQARDELFKIPWVTADKVFLMGHSEGGMTVSRTPISGFKAVISSGYWCHKGLKIKHGSSPFLMLNWQEDPWFLNRSNYRNTEICQLHVDQRPSTTQVLIEGHGHATSGSRVAKLAVEKFLKQALGF